MVEGRQRDDPGQESELIRQAPEAGYDHPEKRQYRRDVWSVIDKAVPRDRADLHALLMPSAEGDEVEVALSKGFRETNLHIVDKNPAIVARHLANRFPRAQRYGVDLHRALERVRRSGAYLSVMHADLTGTIVNVDLRRAIFAYLQTCMSPSIVIVNAQTGLEGRDIKWAEIDALDFPREMIGLGHEQLSRRNRWRATKVSEHLYVSAGYLATPQEMGLSRMGLMEEGMRRISVVPLRAGTYQIGRSPRLWVAVLVVAGVWTRSDLHRVGWLHGFPGDRRCDSR